MMILMIGLAALVFAALSYYVGYNGWVWLKTTFLSKYKKMYIGIIVILSCSLFIGLFSSLLVFKLLGYFWMMIIGYGIILLPICNLLVFLMKKRGIFWIGISVFTVYGFVFIYGSFNAWSPVIRNYNLTVDKKSNVEDVEILMVSDLHIGAIVGPAHIQRLVDKANQVKPDIILIPGDVIDDHIQPYIDNHVGEILQELKAPLGVYAIPGNHDYYGDDLEKLEVELNKAGIKLLMDETVNVDDLFYLVGRKDVTDENRQAVSGLVSELDHTMPIIMMDHTPLDLDIAKENGIDVLLSGHTHKGQVAPANLITSRIYENDWGYLRKSTLQSIVSSGFGTWGPPLRIGSRSEVNVINVKFE